MAEVLGAVASSFAIAGVVVKGGKAIAKLRNLTSEVKNAPSTINDLLTQLEILEHMLADFETQFDERAAPLRPAIFNNAGAIQSAKYCRSVMEELKTTIDDLATEIESSRRRTRSAAKMKVVLRKDTLARLQEQLERAKRFMTLAYMGYQTAMIETLPDIIIAKHTSQSTLPSAETEDETSASQPDREQLMVSSKPILRNVRSQTGIFKLFGAVSHSILGSFSLARARTEDSTLYARLQFPSWLSSTVFHVRAARAQPGWQINLEPVRVRPWDAEIFIAAWDGDLEATMQLVNSGQASFLDLAPNGLNIFSTALAIGHYDYLLQLLQLGFKASQEDIERASWAYLDHSFMLALQDTSPQRELLARAVVSRRTGNMIEFQDGFTCSVEQYTAENFEPAVFVALLEASYPSHYDSPASERLRRRAGNVWLGQPEGLRWRLSPDGIIRSDDIEEALDQGVSLMISITSGFGSYFTEKRSDYCRGAWVGLIQDTIAACPDLLSLISPAGSGIITDGLVDATCTARTTCRRLDVPRTPLVNLLMEAKKRDLERSPHLFMLRRNRRLDVPLLHWLRCLDRCGVDLMEYGIEEQHTFRFLDHHYTFRWANTELADEDYSEGPRLKGFNYGPRPEDWSLIWDMECEEFAGDFWDLVEDRPLKMPGAWVDDD